MSLKLTADIGDLARIRDFVTERLTVIGVTAAAHDDVRLAVDEAVTNVLVHGYRGPGPVSLDLSADGRDLVVQLADQAPPFDLESAPAVDLSPPVDRRSPGGLGLFLIRQSMDEVSQRSVESGNELTLIKRGVVDPELATG